MTIEIEKSRQPPDHSKPIVCDPTLDTEYFFVESEINILLEQSVDEIILQIKSEKKLSNSKTQPLSN